MPTIDDEGVRELLDSDESISFKIDTLLELGWDKPAIIKLGIFAESTVRQRINKRLKEGKTIGKKGTESAEVPTLPVVLRGTERVTPQWMAQRMATLIDGSEKMQAFAEFLLMIPFYGIDILTQLTKNQVLMLNATKGESVKDLMEAMALGQQQSHEAAMEAAQMVGAQNIQAQKEIAIASAKNPMQAAMSQSMMPMFTNLMERLMGTLMPGVPQQGAGLPSDWTKRTEAPKEEK